MAQLLNLDLKRSTIEWTGRKVTGAHNGTVRLIAGQLELNNGRITGGSFVADTTSITILDIMDAGTNKKFADHLLSPDFFNAVDHPQAIYVITKATPPVNGVQRIEGTLTIKNIARPLAFDAHVDVHEGSLTATGAMTVDRTKYEMKYGSGSFFKGLGDTLIRDAFTLNVVLIGQLDH